MCKGELRIERTTQAPTTDSPGEHTQDDGQVNKIVVPAHEGYVADLDLVGEADFQIINQVGIAQIGLLAVGCACFSTPDRFELTRYSDGLRRG